MTTRFNIDPERWEKSQLFIQYGGRRVRAKKYVGNPGSWREDDPVPEADLAKAEVELSVAPHASDSVRFRIRPIDPGLPRRPRVKREPLTVKLFFMYAAYLVLLLLGIPVTIVGLVGFFAGGWFLVLSYWTFVAENAPPYN